MAAYTDAQPTPKNQNMSVDRLHALLQVHPFLNAKIEAEEALRVPTKLPLSKLVVVKAECNKKRNEEVKAKSVATTSGQPRLAS